MGNKATAKRKAIKEYLPMRKLMDSPESLDVGGSLLKGTLFAIMIIALMLILFLNRDSIGDLPGFLSSLRRLISSGFGWFD